MRARVLVSVAVAATIALGATGCEFITQADTQDIRQITDGVNVNVGDIDVRNALVISDTGTEGRFVGTIVNTTSDDETLTIELKGRSKTVDVPANSHIDLGGTGSSESGSSSVESSSGQKLGTDPTQNDQSVVFSGVKTTPGSLVKIYFSYPGAEGASAGVPVLTGQQGEFETLVPTPSASQTAFPGFESTGGSTSSPDSDSSTEGDPSSGTEPTGGATEPGTQPDDSQTDSSNGESGTSSNG